MPGKPLVEVVVDLCYAGPVIKRVDRSGMKHEIKNTQPSTIYNHQFENQKLGNRIRK